MLNQTDVSQSANKNKSFRLPASPLPVHITLTTFFTRFYVLQLLHPIGNDSQVTLYTRWGRVGENGASQTKVTNACGTERPRIHLSFQGPWAATVAIAEFKKQFRSKTATAWEQRVGMVAKKGNLRSVYPYPKYFLDLIFFEANTPGSARIPVQISWHKFDSKCRAILRRRNRGRRGHQNNKETRCPYPRFYPCTRTSGSYIPDLFGIFLLIDCVVSVQTHVLDEVSTQVPPALSFG